ncbi:ABC transporter permease [Sporofaciens musculi]|uniref:ABC transporter permease n=1 Tax=Sporofaciens musculi TaxID=2681861 RepID=UPI002FE6F4B2
MRALSSSIYGKLALTNLKNNRKTYIPYILTAILTVMMYYIMDDLSRNSGISYESLHMILVYARAVIVIFAVIFLFYTNSFLIKRRKKEIGVYNILGMGKRHIARMLIVETMVTAVVSISAGIIFGLIFSKLTYLILLKILNYGINMDFEFSKETLMYTLVFFLVIFLMTLFYNLFQIQLSNPIELLHGGSQGEKEPKTKWFMTVFGVVSLGIGYFIAVTVDHPLAAIQAFFVAVVCVILGTYALFTAGSVALLKGLRRNKKFYYQTKHFSAVAGMIYRMKQNAVGLANICILSTMVLVMISTTISLYVGMEDVLETRYPREFEAKTNVSTPESDQAIERIVEEELANAGVKAKSMLRYHDGSIAALRQGNGFALQKFGNYGVDDVVEIWMIPLEDYNQTEGTKDCLGPDEVYIYSTGEVWGEDTVQIGEQTYQVTKELDNMKIAPKDEQRMVDGYYIIVSDAEQIGEILRRNYEDSDMQPDWVEQMAALDYRLTFDLEGKEEDCLNVMKVMKDRIEREVHSGFCEGRELSREEFYFLYGGLLFIGIYLGSLFLMATVLIMYYKQISEGYDDRERYQIMQKVGMSKREVKHSIRSQVLMVFFLPLVMAVLHISVAFGVITKLLAILNLTNVPLFLICTIITVIVFALFYGIVFSLTAREYYKIVN